MIGPILGFGSQRPSDLYLFPEPRIGKAFAIVKALTVEMIRHLRRG
jgi:hypothetical protein